MKFKKFIDECNLAITDLELDSNTLGSELNLFKRFLKIFKKCLSSGEPKYKDDITRLIKRIDGIEPKGMKIIWTLDNELATLQAVKVMDEEGEGVKYRRRRFGEK